MNSLLVFSKKNPEKLRAWNGHDLRLIKLMEYGNDIIITSKIEDLISSDRNVVIDIPNLGIRQYLSICFRSKLWIRNVFIQDSNVRYCLTKCYHSFKFGRFELITAKFVANLFRAIIREAFFYTVCKKVGFVSEADTLFPSKSIISKNGSDFQCNLKCSGKERLVFWGNIDYEPNLESIVSFVSKNISFFKTHKLHLFGKISNVAVTRLTNKLGFEFNNVITVHGCYDKIEDVIYKDDILFNCVDFGSGIKNKTLEGISLGIRQIATKHALVGVKHDPTTIVYLDNKKSIEVLYSKALTLPINMNTSPSNVEVNGWVLAANSYQNFGGVDA